MARLHSPEDRHFYGHGAFTAGRQRCSSPPRTRSPRAPAGSASGTPATATGGSARSPTGGTGPHEVRLMPDGARLRGGERRHRDRPDLGPGRAQPRDDALEPRLSRRGDAARCSRCWRCREALRLNSIRHIAAGPRRHAGGGAAVAGLGARAAAAPRGAPAGRGRRSRRSSPPSRRCSGGRATTPAASRSATTAGGRRSPRRAADMMLVFDLAHAAAVEVVEATDICGVAAAGGRLRLLDRRGACS